MMVQVTRVEDLLVTAKQVEAGAAERYLEYAEAASTENAEAAALFRRLAEEERKHEGAVLDLASEAGIDLCSGATFSIGSSATGLNPKSPGGTLYEILQEALRREERAFEIYSDIAACSVDDAVRRFSEILAKEELGHAALIRALRRRVFPEHRRLSGYLDLADATKVTTLQEFLSRAFRLETRLNALLRRAHANAENLDECLNLSASIQRQIWSDMDKKPEASQIAEVAAAKEQVSTQSLQREFDMAYDYYDRFVARASNEEIMKYALYLAAKVLERLNTIQVMFKPKIS